MLRRIGENPAKSKEFDEIELGLMGFGPTITPEQNKQLLLSFQKILNDFKKTIILKKMLENGIKQEISNNGIDVYYRKHLEKGSVDRESYNKQLERFLTVTLAGDEKEWLDAQKIIAQLGILAVHQLYKEDMSSLKNRINQELDDVLKCIESTINKQVCEINQITKKQIISDAGSFTDSIDAIQEYADFDWRIGLTFGFKFLTLLLSAINEAFSTVLNPKPADEPRKSS